MATKKTTEKEGMIFKPRVNHTERVAKLLLWFGVGIFSLTIFILWGWALKIRLDYFSWQKTPENKMIETAKTDWDKYFADTKESEENKIKIKNALNQILIHTITTSTVNTTTSDTIISTTTITTSTP